MKIKVEFIQFHEGQGKHPGDTGEYEPEIANHLIKFGYGKKSGLQRPNGTISKVQPTVELKQRVINKRRNEGGAKAGS